MAKPRRKYTKTSKQKTSSMKPCCRIEALVSMDARGQILIPKEVRKKAGWKPGVKLAVISYEAGGKLCRITLAEAEEFAETAREMLGPMMGLLDD